MELLDFKNTKSNFVRSVCFLDKMLMNCQILGMVGYILNSDLKYE